jgi:hypothetical protein
MQSNEPDPELLLQRMLDEVRQRKLGLSGSALAHRKIASSVEPESIIPPTVPQMSHGQLEQRDHLRGALLALQRARSKQQKVRRWLPIIRRIRRNQGAINDSLIDAVQGHLDALQSFRSTFAGFEHKLTKIGEFILDQKRQNAEQQRQLRDSQDQLSEIRASLRQQQHDSLSIEARLSGHEEQQKRELTKIWDLIKPKVKQKAEERSRL